MGPDLALFLSVLGALIDSGDLMSWSMGGTPPPGVGPSAAQNGHGLIGSHNKYENDASPTRPDLYETGNNYITQASQFQDLVNASPGGFVTLESLTAYRSQRYDRQVANNPYFFNGPFTGLLVQPAAFTFIYRFMANHSAAEPLGSLSYETLQTWFGVTGTNGQYSVQNFGYERIPDKWYRRSLAAPYTIPYFLGDVAAAASLYPKFLSVGGNQGGQTSSFAGVDVGNLTGGVFNSKTLLQGNNLGCFAFQASTQFKPDVAPVDIIGQVQNVVGGIVKQLSCPQLQTMNSNLLQQFPGYTRSMQS
jgi:hypothetical protein